MLRCPRRPAPCIPAQDQQYYNSIYLGTLWKGQSGSLLYCILPYVEQQNTYNLAAGNHYNVDYLRMPVYQCPSDPAGNGLIGDPKASPIQSWQTQDWERSNYGPNYLVFGNPAQGNGEGQGKIPATFPDGTSNTILFAEEYGRCAAGGYVYEHIWAHVQARFWAPEICDPGPGVIGYPPCPLFQVSPRWDTQCDITRAQTLHGPVMQVCLGDGSVRGLSSSIAGSVWAYLCDPRDGNVVTNY